MKTSVYMTTIRNPSSLENITGMVEEIKMAMALPQPQHSGRGKELRYYEMMELNYPASDDSSDEESEHSNLTSYSGELESKAFDRKETESTAMEFIFKKPYPKQYPFPNLLTLQNIKRPSLSKKMLSWNHVRTENKIQRLPLHSIAQFCKQISPISTPEPTFAVIPAVSPMSINGINSVESIISSNTSEVPQTLDRKQQHNTLTQAKGRLDEDFVDIDLYGDLESNVFGVKDTHAEEKLTKRLKVVEAKLADTYAAMSSLEKKYTDLRRAHAILTKNSASLLQTAKQELGRKNRLIQFQQKKLEELRKKLLHQHFPKEDSRISSVEEFLKSTSITLESETTDPSFRALVEQALVCLKSKPQTNEPVLEKPPNVWEKSFHHRNVSYYFYSHHTAPNVEPAMEVVLDDNAVKH